MSPFKPITLTLSQLTPSLAVEVLPQGVTVHRVYIQVDGHTHDIIIGPEDPTQYADAAHKYKNTIIGRYTNRIPVGTYSLSKPGDPDTVSPFTSQANESPTVSLHGGPVGFDALPFDVLESPDALKLFSAKEKDELKKGETSSFALFSHTSPDGDQGFPGVLYTEAIVGLTAPSGDKVLSPNDETPLGSVYIVYRAKVSGPNGEKVVTPVNITQHWGFNLDASLRKADTPTIENHLLDIKSSNILHLGAGLIADGTLSPTPGTPFHQTLASGPLSTRYPEGGYDDYYLFDQVPNPGAIAPGRVPLSSLADENFDLLSAVITSEATNPPYTVLYSPESGLKASFDTNQGGVQFWSCQVLTGAGAMKRIHGGTGEEDGNALGYKGGSAAFLEFHEPHAAWLHPDLVEKSITKNDTLLSSDELYNNFVKVDLRIKAT